MIVLMSYCVIYSTFLYPCSQKCSIQSTFLSVQRFWSSIFFSCCMWRSSLPSRRCCATRSNASCLLRLQFAGSCNKNSFFIRTPLLVHLLRYILRHVSSRSSNRSIDLGKAMLKPMIIPVTASSWYSHRQEYESALRQKGESEAINHESFVSADSFRLHNGLYQAESSSRCQ